MLGTGRWIADFNESFWDYKINKLTFKFFIWGGMRPSGFALSKIAARLVLPNYNAACFAYIGDSEFNQLSTLIKAIHKVSKEKMIDWSWLVIPYEGAFSTQMSARVEKDDTRELGIALVNLESEDIVTSQSYVGRRMERFIRLSK